MKKTVIIISSILMVAFAAASTFAWGPNGGMGPKMMGSGFNQDCQGYGGGQNRQNALKDLSKDQRDELQTLRQQFIDETYKFRSAKLQKQQEIRMLMQTSDPDKDELSKLSEEIADLQKQIRDKQIDFKLSAKKIAPELGSRGAGFGKGCGRWSGNGGQKGFHRGQGQWGNQGGRYSNN